MATLLFVGFMCLLAIVLVAVILVWGNKSIDKYYGKKK